MLPPAPGLLSTTTVVPRFSPNRLATMRAAWSAAPPASKPTTMVSGFFGRSCCEKADPATSNGAAKTRRRRCRFMRWLSGDSMSWHRGMSRAARHRRGPCRAEGRSAMSIRRRDLLAWGSASALSTAGCATREADRTSERAAERPATPLRDDGAGPIVQQYDAQGEHRTATPADSASATWLLELARRAGATAGLEPFALQRVDPMVCHASVEGRRAVG